MDHILIRFVLNDNGIMNVEVQGSMSIPHQLLGIETYKRMILNSLMSTGKPVQEFAKTIDARLK